MAASTGDTKSKPLVVSEKLNVVKCVIVRNIPRNKITELGIPVRKVHNKMLRWSDTGESALRLSLTYDCGKLQKQARKI